MLVVISGAALLVCLAASCGGSREDQIDELLEDGISNSRQFGRQYEQGSFDSAYTSHVQAVEQFEQVLALDSNNLKALSSLAFTKMLAEDYKAAIPLFEQALALDSSFSENRRQLGLALIGDGQVPRGRAMINSALALDSSREARRLTAEQLTKIGTEAFQIGTIFGKEDNERKELNHKRFAIAVLAFAHDIDKPNAELAHRLADFADDINDSTTARQYRSLYDSTP